MFIICQNRTLELVSLSYGQTGGRIWRNNKVNLTIPAYKFGGLQLPFSFATSMYIVHSLYPYSFRTSLANVSKSMRDRTKDTRNILQRCLETQPQFNKSVTRE